MDLFVFMGVPASAAVFQALLPWALRHLESSIGAGDFCRSVSARLQHATRFPTAFLGCAASVSPLQGLASFFQCLLSCKAMRSSDRSLPAAVLISLLYACGEPASAPKGHPLHSELDGDQDEHGMGEWGVALRSARWLQQPALGGSSGDVVAGAGEVLLAGVQLAVASGNSAMLQELLCVVGIDPEGGGQAHQECPPDILLLLQGASLVEIAALHGQRSVLDTLVNIDGPLQLQPWQWGSGCVIAAAASGSVPVLVDLLSWESAERLAANSRPPSQSNTSNSDQSSRMSALGGGTPSPAGPAVCRWGDVDVQAGGWAALPIAAALGHVGVVQQLLQFEGERSPAFWVAVHTALLDACRWGRAEVVQLLLDRLPSHCDLLAAGAKCFDENTGRPFFLDLRVTNDAALFHALFSGDSVTLQCVLQRYRSIDVVPSVPSATIAAVSSPLRKPLWQRSAGHRCVEQADDTEYVLSVFVLLRSLLNSAHSTVPHFSITFTLGIRALIHTAALSGNASLVLALLQCQASPLRFTSQCLSLDWDGVGLEAYWGEEGAQVPRFEDADSVLAAACAGGSPLLVQGLLAVHSTAQPTPEGRISWSQRDLQQAAVRACQHGDLEMLQLLCRWGQQFSLAAIPGQSHLHTCFLAACMFGWGDIAQFLQALASTGDVPVSQVAADAADAVPEMASLQPLSASCVAQGLLEASLWAHEHIVAWILEHRFQLLEEGGDTLDPSPMGLSMSSNASSGGGAGGLFDPLVVACAQGHTAVVQAFADSRGVAPVDFGMSADTLFVSACQAGRTGVARLLTRLPVLSGEGVDMNTRDDKPFVEACSGGHLLLARWLLHQTGSNRVDPTVDDSAAFIGACRAGNLPLVMLLAGLRGRDEMQVAVSGSFALVVAAESNHAAVLVWLLAQTGARELDVTENGFRPVAAAATMGSMNVLQVLLAQTGERCVPADVLNCVVLPCVGQEGHVANLRLLLSLPPSRGLDLHAQDDYLYKSAFVNGGADLLSTLHTLPGHTWPSGAQLASAADGLGSSDDEEGEEEGGVHDAAGRGREGWRGQAPHRARSGSESMLGSESSQSGSD